MRADKPTRQLSWDSHCQSFKTSLELDSDICDWFSAEAANKSVHLIVAKKKKTVKLGVNEQNIKVKIANKNMHQTVQDPAFIASLKCPLPSLQ